MVPGTILLSTTTTFHTKSKSYVYHGTILSSTKTTYIHIICTGIYLNHHFHFPAQLVLIGGFTLSDLLDKLWSQVSSLLPPGTCLQFLSRIGFSIPTARRLSSNVANSRSRAFLWSFIYARKSPVASMCTRWELNSQNWFQLARG